MSQNLSVAPFASLAKTDLALIGGGVLATSVLAQIQVPWEPIPFTMQTFAVVTVAAALGLRRGVLAQAAYLGLGAAGAPVFAMGRAGLPTLFGPTGGYLFAFLIAALLVGWASDRSKLVWAAIPFALATILGLGTAYLATAVGWNRAIELGFAPFVVPEILKAVMATASVYAIRNLRGR